MSRRAIRLLGGCLLALGTMSVTGVAAAQDTGEAAEPFKLCAACHSENGHGNVERNAPAIAGLPQWYLERQLENFKVGRRGYHADDVAGLQMRPMGMSLVTDADLKAMAAYVAQMPSAVPPKTVAGDATRGQTLYAPCVACHGAEAKGNEALKAPPLVIQGDWYLVAQLPKFKNGMRGAHKDDTVGMQMRAFAATLPDEQAYADVVSYITSLAK